MKKINVILCTAITMALVAACGDKHHFSVSGTAADDQFNGQTAYLYNGQALVDSAVVTAHGFAFEGQVEQPWMGTVVVRGESARAMLDFVVEPGRIVLDVLTDTLGGTPMNDRLYGWMQSNDQRELEAEMATYLQLYYSATDPVQRAAAERMYDSVDAISIDRTYQSAMELFEAERTSVLGAYALATAAETDRMGYSELKALVDGAGEAVQGYERLNTKMAQLRAVEETSAGKHYTDIQGVDGKLSDLIEGRLALVDFYASWCGPCRAEIKDNLVPLWNKYRQKGLVVVGLNVWERGDAAAREAAHQKVMADLGITYPQLVDSTRTATDTYGVRGIPQIMLIGPDGTILARDLRGAAIEEAVEKALGE